MLSKLIKFLQRQLTINSPLNYYNGTQDEIEINKRKLINNSKYFHEGR